VSPASPKVFRRSQNLYITFDVYDAAPDPENFKARKINVSMKPVQHQRREDLRSRAYCCYGPGRHAPQRGPSAAAGALKGVAPGRYICQIKRGGRSGAQVCIPAHRHDGAVGRMARSLDSGVSHAILDSALINYDKCQCAIACYLEVAVPCCTPDGTPRLQGTRNDFWRYLQALISATDTRTNPLAWRQLR